MTKSEVKKLEDRVVQLGMSTSDAAKAEYEADAEMGWSIRHLSEDERTELSRLLMSAENGQVSREEGERLLHKLLATAAEHASTEPPGLKEEFKQKWIRAETLRHAGRPLSEAEGDELRALNMWLVPDPIRSGQGRRPS